MLIENPDAFKSWLTSVLEPLCDADPEALAKYVFALVKKDKAVDILRQSMLEQLDVFLQAETKPFVELLFKTLESQDYLSSVIPNANPPNPNVGLLLKKEQSESPATTNPPAADLVVKDIKPIIPVSTLPNLSESINGTVARRDESATVAKPRSKSDVAEKDERVRTGGRRSRNRSRSRSWERKRSRSPRTERERRDRIRPWRNKSPPRGAGGARYERRRSRSGSVGRVRSRSRSPRHSYRGRYRNRSPPPRSLTRSRSRSLERGRGLDRDKREGKTDGKEENSGGATPTQDSNHGDTDMRLTNTTQSIQSVVSALNPVEIGTGPANNLAFGSSKRRCRDFDEKGYCMRGEMCPYDHGVDPVVLEDTALTRVLTFGPNGPNGAAVPVDRPAGPPSLLHPPLLPGAPGALMHMGLRPALHPAEYNPSAPAMWHRPGYRGPRPPPMMGPRGLPPMNLPAMQRELISVPVMDCGQQPHAGVGVFKRRMPADLFPDGREGSPEGGGPAKRKPGFDFSRLGPRAKNPVNCSLELKKVPRGLNNITHLNNHFSKFGKIVNIQVCYDGDPEGAIVTFSSHAEANAAYRSTEAVLNNRFIKVFWHSANGAGDRQENVAVAPRPVKDRLGQPITNKVFQAVPTPAKTATPDEDGANVEPAVPGVTAYVPSNVRADQPQPTAPVQTQPNPKALANAAIVKGQEILAAKEQLKKKRKEALKITQDLRKRKQELLEKQLAQQKLLIEKLEKTNPTGQQRDLLMSTIKTVQESIESIQKSMVAQSQPVAKSPTTSSNPALKKSKEEAQKEVLDAELDLITKQQEGGDTSELQRRLLELRAQAYTLTRGSRPVRASRRGRGAVIRHALLTKNNLVLHNKKNNLLKSTTRGSARGGLQKQTTVVDHRPTKLLVSGYEADESDSVLAHFNQYGVIIDYVTDESTPSILLNYKTRKEAEVALLKGKHFQDRTLSVTWCISGQLNNQRTTSRTVLLSETSEDHLLEGDDDTILNEPVSTELSEEALLQDDEDDDDEERSWRR